jgi:hypothetical protein
MSASDSEDFIVNNDGLLDITDDLYLTNPTETCDILSQLRSWHSSNVSVTVGGVKIEMANLNNTLLTSIINEMDDFIVDHDKNHGQACYDRGGHDKVCFDRARP